MKKVILALGSNLGNRINNIENALELLHKRFFIIKSSSMYESRSLLLDDQPDYLNIVALIDTDMPPEELLCNIKEIEKKLGRDFSTKRWGARIIDIDIIDYNGEVIDTPTLKTPHVEIKNRLFVLLPLKEILPDYEFIDDMIKELHLK